MSKCPLLLLSFARVRSPPPRLPLQSRPRGRRPRKRAPKGSLRRRPRWRNVRAPSLKKGVNDFSKSSQSAIERLAELRRGQEEESVAMRKKSEEAW